jgi:hypothetical protein
MFLLRSCMVVLAGAGFAPLLVQTARAAPLPRQVGQCSETTIRKIETRLVDGTTGKPIAGSGSAVVFANHGYQVSYDEEPAIENSRRGDRVRICLDKLPENCPPGDARGRVYTTTNLRTGQSWTLPDSEHSCGGA